MAAQDPANDKLRDMLRQYSQKTMVRFQQLISQDVTNPELLAILNELQQNWKNDIRPILTSLSCQAVGGNGEAAETAGLAFSLAAAGMAMHDDIIDQTVNKRFKHTILGKYGVEKTLLVGDLLIAKGWAAIRMICQSTKIAEFLELYGKVSVEVCEAELMETSFRKKPNTPLNEYKRMLWKAAAGIEACTKFGSILGEGSSVEVNALASYGRNVGVMLALEDDLIDCLNVEGSLPHRLEFESVPLPILYAAHTSKNHLSRIEEILGKSKLGGEDARDLLCICFETEALNYTFERLISYTDAARLNLAEIKSSEAKDTLLRFIDAVVADVTKLCGELK